MTGSVPAKTSAARRGRPPGRSPYQEKQRQQTRAAILGAAAEIFSSTPYIHATIDDIVGAARVSRATFYDHFESKLALAVAIYDGIAADWLGHFDRLAERTSWDDASLQAWIRALADLYVAHGYVTPLVEQLMIFEQSFRRRVDRDRDALIDRLAEAGVGGFAAALGATPDAILQRARIRLLLLRLDQICGIVSRPDAVSTVDATAYIEVLAGEIRGAMHDPAA
jgi:AcrR family transcriptional regulator